jgi:hypothetical protein
MHAPLSTDVKVYQQIKERLIRDYALGEDDQALIDTLDGCSDLKERITALARKANERKYLAAGLKALIDDQKARLKRLEEGEEKLRDLVAWAMSEAGIDKITAPDMTISQRMGAKPLLIDPIDPEKYAGSDYVREKVTYSFDRDAIKRAMNEGAVIPWARFGNPAPVLTIRTK